MSRGIYYATTASGGFLACVRLTEEHWVVETGKSSNANEVFRSSDLNDSFDYVNDILSGEVTVK